MNYKKVKNQTKFIPVSKPKSVKESQKGFLKGNLTKPAKVFEQIFLQNNVICNINLEESLIDVMNLHNSLIKNHGIIPGTSRYKSIVSYAIIMMEGGKPENPGFLKTGKRDLWPSCLKSLRPAYYCIRDKEEGWHIYDQFIRSAFAMQRQVKDNTAFSSDSITKKWRVSRQHLKEFDEFVKSWVEVSDVKQDFEFITRIPSNVSSSGPNGEIKIDSAQAEAFKLTQEVTLWRPFSSLCKMTGNKDFLLYVESLAKGYATNTGDDKTKKSLSDISLRRIVAVPDVGNKSRIVAICDFWTQILLEPLEAKIVKILEQKFQGVSFLNSHENGFKKVKSLLGENSVSLDISAWTDRFPTSLQRIVLRHLFNEALANNWAELVCHCFWDNPSGVPIRYSVGQGMGTRGSFQIASITNILYMAFVLHKEYEIPIGDSLEGHFVKVGDDDFVSNDPKGAFYFYYTKKLGLDINLTKSKFSRGDNMLAEFVSRNINYGEDVSRISIKVIRNCYKNVYNIPNLVKHLSERSQLNVKELASELYNHCGFKDHVWENFACSMALESGIEPEFWFETHAMEFIEGLPDSVNHSEKIRYISDNLYEFEESYLLYCLMSHLDEISERMDIIAREVQEFPEMIKAYKSLNDLVTYWDYGRSNSIDPKVFFSLDAFSHFVSLKRSFDIKFKLPIEGRNQRDTILELNRIRIELKNILSSVRFEKVGYIPPSEKYTGKLSSAHKFINLWRKPKALARADLNKIYLKLQQCFPGISENVGRIFIDDDFLNGFHT